MCCKQCAAYGKRQQVASMQPAPGGLFFTKSCKGECRYGKDGTPANKHGSGALAEFAENARSSEEQGGAMRTGQSGTAAFGRCQGVCGVPLWSFREWMVRRRPVRQGRAFWRGAVS